MHLGIRQKNNGNYYESHHILPKSLFPLWKNKKSNKVLLTAREHFFCHQLLTKIYPSSQMFFALHAFVSRPNADYKITSKEYERLKIEFRKRSSEVNKGKVMSIESRQKIKESLTGRTLTNEHKKHLSEWVRTDEMKQKMSLAHKGKPSSRRGKILSEETKQRMAAAHRGKSRSEDTKKKISETLKNRRHYVNIM